MSRIRVVVADQAEAIFYDMTSLKSRLVEVGRCNDPNARRATREMSAQQNRPGRSYESVGGQRHVLGDEPQELRRQQAAAFARTVAERLDADRRERAFQQLIVVASAPFRGLLRSELSAGTKACIVYEVPKDLVHSHVEVLRDYLPDCAQELKSA
jgi:protein required for attachment to host cells